MGEMQYVCVRCVQVVSFVRGFLAGGRRRGGYSKGTGKESGELVVEIGKTGIMVVGWVDDSCEG